MSRPEASQDSKDGGYYAIKGFTYQFDKSLLEILDNPTSDIELENIQDIGNDDYYIQVKYRETQKYSASKIRPAVVQLLQCFNQSATKKTKLYCYFVDKLPRVVALNVSDLNQILGKQKSDFTEAEKLKFIKSFTLEFSVDFESQFAKLITEIKRVFGLTSDEIAVTHHAIFKSYLLDIALKKKRTDRKVSLPDLRLLAAQGERIIFEEAYSKYLTQKKYLEFVRKTFFTHKRVNIAPNERLFVIEIDKKIRDSDIKQILTNIISRYHRKDSSPAPYIYLYGIENERFINLKQKFWNEGMSFSDGTHFHNDKFRIKDFIEQVHKNHHSKTTFKLVEPESLSPLLKSKVLDETYVFLTTGDGIWRNALKDFKEFYIGETKNLIKIIS